MNPSNDSLKRAWELLKADSFKSADNPFLENRLMNEMKKLSTPRTWKRKLALAAGLLIGFLAIGSGIAVAAGYNPFKALTILIQDGNVVITDENGNAVPPELVNVDVKDENGQKEVTVRFTGDTQGKVKARSAEKPK